MRHIRGHFLPCLILTLLLRTASAQVVLSEFMAGNSRTLADEDGEFSDWIEIHNTGTAAVNLLDWSLTDDPAQLVKWRFPATNIVGGGFIVVFASDKNRRTPGAPLHANFKLTAGGEYLALVEPDGATIATAFTPAFPPQASDVSYGLDPGLRITALLLTNAMGKVLVPAGGSLGTNWILPAFDDSSWRTATSGIGFSAVAIGASPLPGLTSNLVANWRFDETNGLIAAESAGRGSNGALVNFPATNSQWTTGINDGALKFRGSPNNDYVRVANYPKATNALTVSAWVLAEGRPTWASIAKNWGGTVPGQFHFGLRDTAGDLDIFIHTSTGDFSVREGSAFPTGQWQHVMFTAENGTLRLFRNGALVGSGSYAGNFLASATGPLGIGAKLNDAGTAADSGSPGYWQGRIDDLAIWNRSLTTNEAQAIHAAGAGYGGFVGTDVRASMLGSNATCYLRLPFVVDNPGVLTRWRLKMRYDDGFVAWLNGEEIVRRNAAESLAWNSQATNEQSATDGVVFEEFNLSAFEEAIVSGTNLLAIQGLNLTKDDADFLIQPFIEASSITDMTNALVYFTTPTPNAENVVGVAELGPIIKDVAHAPLLPLDNDNLFVTTKVAPTFAATTNVTLRYRVMFSNEVALPMFDDGAHGDGLAGDGVYGATIPATASTNGQMVRYYISAADALGRASRAPFFNDPQDSDQYFGTVVQNPAISTPLPVFHWFVATPAAAETDAGTRCSLFYDGEFYDNIFIRIRGGTARAWPKKSYKVEFNENHEFLLQPGRRRVTEFDFNATYTDKSYVRAVLASEHQRDAGLPTPEIFHVHLRQNVAFYSVALYTENVDKDFLAVHGMDENGALYKGGPGSTMDTTASYEKKTRRTEGNQDLQALLAGVALSGTALENFLFDKIDLPEVVNYMATMAVTQDIDGTDKNHFVYRDTEGTGEWRLLPWDIDLTFGPDALNTDTIVFNLQNTNGPACASHPFIGARPYLLHVGKYQRLIEAMANNPRTRAMLLRRTRTLTEQFLMSGYFQERIEQLYPLLLADVTADRTRWGANAHFGGTTYTLRAALDRIKNEYLAPRPSYLTGTNIAGVGLANPQKQPLNAVVHIGAVEFNPSSGNQSQEYVCLTNPSPFAVDLSGWRLSGGVDYAFEPGTVILFNSVLYLSPDVSAFRARTSGPRGGQSLFVQGNYSGQLSARGETLRLLDTFGVVVHERTYAGNPSLAQQFLRVTELMYHPVALAGDTNGAEEFEYIEVTNISTNQSVNLSGVRFVNGVEFDFTHAGGSSLAPGQRILVVKNGLAFAARYGWNLPLVAGEYLGSLDNGGERIRFVDAAGEEILDFDYNNTWHPLTDGHGFSLVVVDEHAEPDAWGRQSQWRASGRLNGSPSLDDPPFPVITPVVINEALTRSDVPPPTDSIELHNPTAAPADVSGWFLTDDFNTPKKFRIPNGTSIPAGGFGVFTETDFNPGGAGFALGSDGDEVWLFSASTDGNLTGYVHGFNFGAADDGVSFGRYLNSVGEEHFVAQLAVTPNAINVGPKVGPIVINEIMYHPPELPNAVDNSEDEFIELLNITTASVQLFDPVRPTNTWKLTGAVSFVFPGGESLGTGESLLFVNFDPATNAPALAAFRAKYSVSTGVRILGPLGGKLNNSGERLELKKPTTPIGFVVPSVLVDQVAYRDAVPWSPGADGFGLSLQRKNSAAYGNDPVNWTGAPATAGAATTSGGTPPVISLHPLSQTLVAYQNATFTVGASGAAPLRYQWRFNGVPLSDATNSALVLNSVQPTQAGNYEVLVFNSAGSTVSSNAALSLRFPATVLQPPQSVQVRVRPDTNAAPMTNATFSVLAYSPTPLSYQWRFNGVEIPGATGATLTITNVQTSSGGDFSVAITDNIGTIISPPATLVPLVSPTIVFSPLSQTVPVGATVTLSVVASGSPFPLAYEWRRGSIPVANNMVNSFTNFYTFTATNIPTTFTYRVIVRNLANNGVNANAMVSITTVADSDGDGIPDLYETEYGAGGQMDPMADDDGDGVKNFAEYIAGTEPTNALSYLKIDSIMAGNGATLRFNAASNRTYSVQYTDTLGAGLWQKLLDLVGQTNAYQGVVTDADYTTNRFYRLTVPQQP